MYWNQKAHLGPTERLQCKWITANGDQPDLHNQKIILIDKYIYLLIQLKQVIVSNDRLDRQLQHSQLY